MLRGLREPLKVVDELGRGLGLVPVLSLVELKDVPVTEAFRHLVASVSEVCLHGVDLTLLKLCDV